MRLLCLLGYHSWSGCKCTRCGTTREAEHAWVDGKCTKCGANARLMCGDLDGSPSGQNRMKRVTKVQTGLIVREWHPQLDKWIPGWWREITKVTPAEVCWIDLRNGEEETIPLDRIERWIQEGTFWTHELPEAVKMLGDATGQATKRRLEQLEGQYEAYSLLEMDDADIVSLLIGQLSWTRSHSNIYDKDEYPIHVKFVKRIGEEINRRGGFDLMYRLFHDAGGSRDLEFYWDGIGNWRG